MLLRKWSDLPEYLKNDKVKVYYNILNNKKIDLFFKALLDKIISFILLIILFVPMLLIAIIIKIDSKGSVFYRQERVTQYGKLFKIHKFRTIVENAEIIGSQITIDNDKRITRVGTILRKLRLDELPQLIDVLCGNMTFVGTRSEVPKYVDKYTDEMYATLLLPAGKTSEASIMFKDGANLLKDVKDVDNIYLNDILINKMKYNLESLKKFNFINDLSIMCRTMLSFLEDNTLKRR